MTEVVSAAVMEEPRHLQEMEALKKNKELKDLFGVQGLQVNLASFSGWGVDVTGLEECSQTEECEGHTRPGDLQQFCHVEGSAGKGGLSHHPSLDIELWLLAITK